MEITTKQLRVEPGKIISQVNKGMDVTITYRGKPSAKIVPLTVNEAAITYDTTDDELFGIWADREETENVEKYVRNMRKGRQL